MNKNTIISIIIIVIALAAIIFFAQKSDSKPGVYDEFATCLDERGAMFFGAFWCPHCQDQKRLFGRKSAELVPYTECSTPDGGAQTEVCIEAEIEGYPTWEFANAIKITSEENPVVCSPLPGVDNEDPVCKNPGVASSFRTSWIFPNGTKVQSKDTPTTSDNIWTFDPMSRISGVVSLENLSEKTSCELPL